MGKLSVKNVKLIESLSEETPCFTADVYEDGKLIAHASNRGHGGCNDYSPANGLKAKDITHLWEIDNDCLIMTLAEEYNIVKKSQTKSWVLKKDGKIYTSNIPNGHSFAKLKKSYSKYDEWVEKQKSNWELSGYKILNTNL
jgi:hypothetical protein